MVLGIAGAAGAILRVKGRSEHSTTRGGWRPMNPSEKRFSKPTFNQAVTAVFTTKVGVLGAGVTGVRVVEHLRALGHSNILVSDKVSARAQRLSALHSTNAIRVEAVTREELFECTVVVLAFGAPHAHLSSQFIQRGVSVVSLSDNVADCMNLLALDAQSKRTQDSHHRWCRFKSRGYRIVVAFHDRSL
jgi:hypothetical protein